VHLFQIFFSFSLSFPKLALGGGFKSLFSVCQLDAARFSHTFSCVIWMLRRDSFIMTNFPFFFVQIGFLLFGSPSTMILMDFYSCAVDNLVFCRVSVKTKMIFPLQYESNGQRSRLFLNPFLVIFVL